MRSWTNTWRHIRRSPYQAFAAIFIMTLTFVVGGVFVLLSVSSYFLLQYVEQKPQVIVFFNDVKKEEDIKSLMSRLENDEKVAEVKYISKAEALNIYKEQFKNDPLLLEMVSEDILPASLEVSAVKLDYLTELATTLEKETDVQEIAYHKNVIEKLLSWIQTIRNFGLGLMLFLGIESVLIIMMIISMKIALKRKEVEIMQLIGASSSYVQLPFILEGILYGVVGAFIGWGLNVLLLWYVKPMLAAQFSDIPNFQIPLIFYISFLGGMLGVGMLLGLISSLLALRRYLR